MSISLEMQYYFPRTDSEEDRAASDRIFDFRTGIFAHPIYSEKGDYPDTVKERVNLNSEKENRFISRLPKFTYEEIEMLKGSSDYFSINHYTTFLVSAGEEGPNPSIDRDSGAVVSSNPLWQPTNEDLKWVPWGFRGLLNQVKEKYNNPPVFVTENGCYLRNGLIEDCERIKFHNDYMEQMMLAIYEDNCNVIGYTVWSCIDVLEWGSGFSENLGLFYVNFTNPDRPRIKKDSAHYFEEMLKTKKLPSVNCEV